MVAVPVGEQYVVRPDPRRRSPGRGAWLHPDPSCLEQAQRRRAFARALRVDGPVDLTGVAAHVAALVVASTQDTAIGGRPGSPAPDDKAVTESGFDADEHAMSPQQ